MGMYLSYRLFGFISFSLLPFSNLLHLLSQSGVPHSRSHHRKEEGWEERAEVESRPGDGVGQQNLFPLPVHCPHDLIGKDRWAHTIGQLVSNSGGYVWYHVV